MNHNLCEAPHVQTELLESLRPCVMPGGHVCVIFDSATQRTAIASQFLRDGLARREFCLYAAEEEAEREICAALEAGGVNVAEARERGALHFPRPEAAYLRSGSFDEHEMMQVFRSRVAAARAEGYRGCRFAGEPTCALTRPDLADGLCRFESLVNEFFPDSEACGLCMYDSRLWPAAFLRRILRTHPVVVVGDAVCRVNPYYEPPAEAADVDAQRLAEMLEQVRAASVPAAALESLRAAQAQLRGELDASAVLHQVSTELIHHEGDERVLYERIVDAAAAIMRSPYATMQMFHPERGAAGELRLLAFRGFAPTAAAFWEWVSAESPCICGHALRLGKRAVINDVDTCEFLAGTEHQAAYRNAGIFAMQSTPLFSRTGELVGMISTHWDRKHEPSARDLRLLDILARQAADVIERVRGAAAIS